jgi:hypothetical protein
MEYTDKDPAHAIRVGLGAAKARFWGIASKLANGLVMFIVAAAAAVPYGEPSDDIRRLRPKLTLRAAIRPC